MSKQKQENSTVCKVRLSYRYTDLMALSEYLEQQAQKGWYLTSLETGTFTAGEKKIVRYCVEVIPEADRIADDRASGEDDDFQELLTLCEDSGWTFVCHKNDVCVFMSGNPRSPAINTDRAAKVNAIRKAERRMRVSSWCTAAVMLIGMLILTLNDHSGIQPRLRWSLFGLCAVVGAAFLYEAIESLVNERRWLKMERDAEAAGWPVPYFDTEYVRRRDRRLRVVQVTALVAAAGAFILNCLLL